MNDRTSPPATQQSNQIDASLRRSLRLNYTTPELVFYRIYIDGTNTLLVIGGDGEGSYEWVALKGGALDKHSDCGYGMADIALRDGLIYCFGLPPADGYFMREIAPKTEPAISPSAVAVDSPQTWVAAEKAKLDAYEDAARSVEKLAEDYTHEHGSYDGSTNAWELHHRHAEYIEALDAAVEAIRKRKAEKCHITKAKAL